MPQLVVSSTRAGPLKLPDWSVVVSAMPSPEVQSPRPQTQPLPGEDAASDGAQDERRDDGAEERDAAAREQDGDTDRDDDQRPEASRQAAGASVEPAQLVGERDAAQQDEEDPPEQVAAVDSHDPRRECRPSDRALRLIASDWSMMDLRGASCQVQRDRQAHGEGDSQAGVWEDPQ